MTVTDFKSLGGNSPDQGHEPKSPNNTVISLRILLTAALLLTPSSQNRASQLPSPAHSLGNWCPLNSCPYHFHSTAERRNCAVSTCSGVDEESQMSFWTNLVLSFRVMNFQCRAKVPCFGGHYGDVLWCVTGKNIRMDETAARWLPRENSISSANGSKCNEIINTLFIMTPAPIMVLGNNPV